VDRLGVGDGDRIRGKILVNLIPHDQYS